MINYFEKCSECKREILISIALFGTNHNAGISVTCKKCLKKKGIDKEFKKQNPESTKEIEEWLNKNEK